MHFNGTEQVMKSGSCAALCLEDLQKAVKHSVDFYVETTADCRLVSANHGACTLFDIGADSIGDAESRSSSPEGRAASVNQGIVDLLSRRFVTPGRFIRQHRKPDGATIQVAWNISKGSAFGSLIAIGQNITAQIQGEIESNSAREKTMLLLDNLTEGCISIDKEWRFSFINKESARWLGQPKEMLIGKNIWEKFPEGRESDFFRTFEKAMSEQSNEQCDGYYAPQGRWLSARAFPSEEGLTIFFLDISNRKRKEDRLSYAGSHDLLTGLINRESCLQEIEETMALAGDARLGSMALLLIDLDNFKEVNDAVGYHAGDHVLRLLATRFRELSNESRYCARFSGDVFLFVLYPCTIVQAEQFAKRLLDEIVKPFHIAGQRLIIGASVGIAPVTEDDNANVGDLINQANTAMHAVKTSGRLAIKVFDPSVAHASRRRLQLRNEMNFAIESGQFELYYQPQIRLRDGSVSGVEALIRWNHPAYGLLSPAAFLDIAEESPLILQLGAWVCDAACRQLAQWTMSGFPLQVAINVSARQLIDPNFPRVLCESVSKHGVDPKCIELEITESMLTQDLTTTASMLTQLAEKGFRVALDDFGTGYSNLAYINRLPINVLKIDRSFIADIESDDKAMSLVNGIAALAKSLHMEVICEGVETQAQRLALERTQCDTIQGYLISRPLPSDQLRKRFFETSIV